MKLYRLLGILTVLLQNDRVTAPHLADKFEVTRRTIARDIDTLCEAGIPVITYQGSGGGISIAEGYKLDKSILTADELSGIIAAVKGMGSVSEPSQVERTLDKLGANSNTAREPVVIDLASYYRESLVPKIELIKRAIVETRFIEFDYYSDKGEARRLVEPYFVAFQWSSWYVFAFCPERRDWRLFKLARLWNLHIRDERYAPREIPPEKLDFNAMYTDDIKLVAVFEPSEKYRLIESYGPDSFTETPDGLRFEFGFTGMDYLVSWLLGFGDRVKVLEPANVAENIRDTAKKIFSRYG